MSLFKIWQSQKKPKEWQEWEDFRSWAIENRYKAEYGYKGEFAPNSLLKAMPDYKPPKEIEVKEEGKNASKKTSTRSRSRKKV